MANHSFGKNALGCAVLTLYVLWFGAGSWASTIILPQKGPAERWLPRRVPAEANFVGDQVCAACHRDKVTSLSQSGMGRALESVADSRVLIANPTMTFRNDPYSYEIRRKDKQSLYSVTDGQETISLPILYALGQGKAGQTYVLQYQGGLFESRVSFYKEVGGLDFTIGQPRTVPSSLKAALGRRLSDKEVLNCFGCHSTGAINGGLIHLDKMTPGIRCEACHGPGGQHVSASNAIQPSAALIFNPGRLGGDEVSQDFCASCHRVNDEFSLLKSMEVDNVRFQPYRIFHSKCYSDDRRISCTACHNPHEPLKQEAAHYDAKCLACHALKGSSAGSKSSQETQKLVPGCPVSTKDCTSCHMPKLGPAAAHFKFTDHYIRIVKPREAYPN
jgi:hypothetical protein